jgi:tRNA pseudouridine38-40 synthase
VRNLKITLEYDGTRYRGWQVQKNARTVGGAFSEVLATVLKESPPVVAAGRTDAGVHALAQVVSFRTRSPLPPRDLRERLNDALPADINILDVEPAPNAFHARHAAVSRTYRYQISTRRTAFGKRFVWWVRSPLDVDRLHADARLIAGAADFRSFAEGPAGESDEGSEPSSSRVKVLESVWSVEEHLLVYRIRADRFLWRMVRRLVGTMVAGALRQIPEGSLARWLSAPSRESAALTAPPSGLFLESVEYPPSALGRR